jgi:SAM-dependent methyltransferase
MLNNQEEYIKMAKVEKEHWWYKNLHDITLQQIQKYTNSRSIKIVDAGCGTGGFLEYINSKGYENISGLDLSKDAVGFCNKKGLIVIHDNILNIANYYKHEDVDIVVSNDTLYYFEGQKKKEVIKSFANILKPNSILIMNLPALSAFRGTHDIAVGIKKRFTRKEVFSDIRDSGFTIKEIIFWPFLLSPIIFFTRFLQRINIRLSKKSKEKPSSDVYLPISMLNRILYLITRFERMIPCKPWGSSLLVVLQKGN